MEPTAFLRGRGQASLSQEETPVAAMDPAGCRDSLIATAAPKGPRKLRIGLPGIAFPKDYLRDDRKLI